MPFVRPVDVALDQTLHFLHRILPAPPLRILKVGCGSGDLAKRLLRQGFDVTPLDASPKAVGAARAAGVPAVEADFLDYHRDPRRFEIIDAQDVPSPYRYLIHWIEESQRGRDFAQRLLEIETRRIAQTSLAPSGFRVVAKKC